MTMDLLKSIKNDRAHKRRKEPFRHGLFERIASMVKQHHLDEAFLERLNQPPPAPLANSGSLDRLRINRIKAHQELPPFPLVTREEYLLSRAIIERADCPYLPFALSPDEVVLCRELYSRNPTVEPEKLAYHHFETLLLQELAREMLEDHEDQLRSLIGNADSDEADAKSQSKPSGKERLRIGLIRARIQELNTFIDSVDRITHNR